MDTQQLTYFLALCDTLNYTAAAERCFISRQAMRQSLQALEAAYGISLIENRKNRLSLTPAGKLLQKKAMPVISAYAELEAAMRACHASSVPLRVGVSQSILPFYAPEIGDALEKFPSSYPGIVLDITLLPSHKIVSELMEGKLDAGLIICDSPLPLPLERTVLREYTMTVILSKDHPLAARANIRLQDLDGVPMNVMSDPEVCFPALAAAFAQQGLCFNYTVVPEYFDVGCNIRDNLTVGMDRTGAPASPQFAQARILPLENNAFTLCTTLLLPSNASVGAQLLSSFLQAKA